MNASIAAASQMRLASALVAFARAAFLLRTGPAAYWRGQTIAVRERRWGWSAD